MRPKETHKETKSRPNNAVWTLDLSQLGRVLGSGMGNSLGQASH